MPDEFKPSRSYHEALRRLGIQNPGEVSIGVPVQLQAAVDDFSHLVAPLQVPVAIGGNVAVAVAAQYGGLELATTTNGVWVEWVYNGGTADLRLGTSQTTMGDVSNLPYVPSFALSAPHTAVLTEIYGTATLPANGPLLIPNSGQIIPVGFFLPPGGWIVHLICPVANTAVYPAIAWREVPRTDPGIA